MEKCDKDGLAEDRKVLHQTLRQYIEGALIQQDLEYALGSMAEDVVGTGMGEQGYYLDKRGLRQLFGDISKEGTGIAEKSVRYENVDIRIFPQGCASINAEVYFSTTIDGKTKTSSFLQMASAKKENGRWLWFMVAVAPLALTEESIEALPVTFAEGALAQLKAELQSDTFDLMNQSFSGGIMVTLVKENYPLQFANDSLIQMLGYGREEFETLFRDDTLALNYADDKRTMKDFTETASASREDFGIRTRLAKKDGSPIWVEFRTRRTEDELGNDIFLSVIMDVSELANLQRETRKQNKKILASIDYASKIQRQLLPADTDFQREFADHAILWKPRDIVGGDFYWLKSFAAGSVLCVCDCTGHGTPGALLTMLVASALETIAGQEDCRDVARLIWLLEQRLLQVLNVDSHAQSGDSGSILDIRNGCDLAVLYVARDGAVSVAAGNMRVLVCDGQATHKIKGQKLRIGEGRLQCKEDVIVTNIPANPHNKFYIASDGLYDQIGGEAGVPYGYKAFQKMILENHSEALPAIVEKVWGAFELYRGEQARRDDIELIAFQPKGG